MKSCFNGVYIFIRQALMMKCSACKIKNLDAAGFCSHCGSPLERPCSSCGAGNPPDSNYCNQCGHPLNGSRPDLPDREHQPIAYTPKFLADRILTRRASIEGERKRVTVLFADVADFTAMSEKFDPEEMHGIMDGCFTVLMDQIHKYEGTINQFTGDGIMALFGAPLAHEDHAQRACYAALDIQQALVEFSGAIQRRFGIAFHMRIGLNSGPVVVGAIGDDLRMDYTAIGNTTNLSARMQSIADPGTIRVSRSTYRLARDYFDFRALGTTLVKGKAEPQETYELKASRQVSGRLEASARKGLTSYTGRRDEQAALEKALEKACSGHGQVVGISGEPGVGKSRLVHELRRSLNAGIAYLEGRCVQYGKTIAFLPFKDILRDMLHVGTGDPPESITRKIMAHTESICPEDDNALAVCQDLLGVPVGPGSWKRLLPKERKARAFEVLRTLLMHAGRDNPLVLVVDDLHWVDKTSEAFLERMIQEVPGAPILMLLVYRPEYRHAGGGHPGTHEISLSHLPEKAGARLIESILAPAAVAPEVVRLVLDRSDGNPLFMEELIRKLIENGAIRMGSGRCDLDGSARTAKIPENIHGIIAARMDSLEDHVKRVLQLAAVIGRDFEHRVLQAIHGHGETLDASLATLQEMGFIYRKHRYPGRAYLFKHALTQEVAYKSLLRRKRARYHALVAGAIERLYARRIEDSCEVLAHHYGRSEDAQKAYEYLRLSGEKAIRTHFLWEAYDYFKKALAALDDLPKDETCRQLQLEVLHLMIIPIIALGLPEDSLAYLETGVRISSALDDQGSMTRFYSNIGVFFMNRGDYDQGTTYTRRAFETAERIADVDTMAQSGPDLCQDLMNAGKFGETIRVATRITEAVETAGRQSDYFGGMTNIYSIVTSFIGYGKGVLGDFAGGFIACENALDSAIRFAGPETIGVCQVQLGSLHLLQGSHGQAFKFIGDGFRHLEEANFYWHLPWGRSMLGLAETFLGHPRSGLVHIEKALAENRKIGIEWRRSVLLFNLGVCQFFLADYQSARQAMKQAHVLSVESGQGYIAGKALTWLGRIASRRDLPSYETAADHISRGIEILGQLGIRPERALGHLFLGELHARSGKSGLAVEQFNRATQMFQDMGMHPHRRSA